MLITLIFRSSDYITIFLGSHSHYFLPESLPLTGVELGKNATVRDADNESQPDALWRIDAGGRAQIRDDDYVRSHSVESSQCLVFGARGERFFLLKPRFPSNPRIIRVEIE